ncbi:hypothetical protein [uncultured Hoeflea sp.]|uniref:hypothetical protein n=1 Tax=uncultured Hoeflea sp. TaxID=538666 RepID=UPI00261DBA21|nr:hypothetical protein [uncultured Hoeflea sp.]
MASYQRPPAFSPPSRAAKNTQAPRLGFAPPAREPSPAALPALLALALGFAIALALYAALNAATHTGVHLPSAAELSK